MRCGELKDFAKSCFMHYLRFDVDVIFSSILVPSLIAREIKVEGARQYEIWFGIGQRKVRF